MLSNTKYVYSSCITKYSKFFRVAESAFFFSGEISGIFPIRENIFTNTVRFNIVLQYSNYTILMGWPFLETV